MKNVASTTGSHLALSAAAMSVICAWFIPYGYPWPSLAWAMVAFAAAVSVVKGTVRPMPSMRDVISGVEAEPARESVAPGRRAV